MSKVDVLGVPVTTGSLKQQADVICETATSTKGGYVCVANVHMLTEARADNEYRKILAHSLATVPDGMPLVWLLRRGGILKQERVAGFDLTNEVLARSEDLGLRVFFYGSTEKILALIKSRVTHQFPRLPLVGTYSPPFGSQTDQEEAAIREFIKEASPNVIFVGLGCPKQERWMFKNQDEFNAVLIGVGGVFPLLAGTQPRAHALIRRAGLEWLFRLALEPKRLIGRYLKTNLKFFGLLVGDFFKR